MELFSVLYYKIRNEDMTSKEMELILLVILDKVHFC